MSIKSEITSSLPNIEPWVLAEQLRLAASGAQSITTDQLLVAANQLGALSSIFTEMDGREWNSDTANSISLDFQGIGLNCRNQDDCDCTDRSWDGPEHDSACTSLALPDNHPPKETRHAHPFPSRKNRRNETPWLDGG